MSAGWDRYPVLRGVDLEVRPGELVALMGRNGSGKTTLLRLVAGLHRPSSGRVLIDGQDTARLHPADIAQTVGYLPQNPSALFFAETLRAELSFTLKHHRQSGLDPEAILAMLGLEHAIDRNPRDLSGGERERAALAAVLVGGPRVLLLDEPTRGMDAARKRALVATLRQLRDDGVAILLATHDVELVAEVATRVTLLGDGRIVADGGPRTVLSGSLTVHHRGQQALRRWLSHPWGHSGGVGHSECADERTELIMSGAHLSRALNLPTIGNSSWRRRLCFRDIRPLYGHSLAKHLAQGVRRRTSIDEGRDPEGALACLPRCEPWLLH